MRAFWMMNFLALGMSSLEDTPEILRSEAKANILRSPLIIIIHHIQDAF